MTIRKFLAICALAFSALAIMPAAVQAAPLHRPVNVDTDASGRATLNLGDRLLFFRRMPFVGTNVSVQLDQTGAMNVLSLDDGSFNRQDRFSLGDEDRFIGGFEATHTGTFTVTVTHRVVGSGAKNLKTFTITVVP